MKKIVSDFRIDNTLEHVPEPPTKSGKNVNSGRDKE